MTVQDLIEIGNEMAARLEAAGQDARPWRDAVAPHIAVLLRERSSSRIDIEAAALRYDWDE